MHCNMPGFPVFHHLLEFAQTHVHWVNDIIQLSHPLSPPSLLALNLSQQQELFQWVSYLYQVAKLWSFSFSISPSNEYSGLISFRMDWFDLLDVWETLKSLLQRHSSKVSIVCHSTFFMVQLLQYMTAGKDKIGEDSWDCWAPGGGQANQAPGLTTLQHDKTNSINVKPELQFAHRLMMISVQVLVLGL